VRYSFKMSVNKTIATFLSKVLSKEQMEELKSIALKLEGEIAVPVAPAPIATPTLLKEMKTKDGKTLSVEGELKEGAALMIVSETGPAPAPDADYELEDGTIVSVAGGLVTVIKPAALTPAPVAPVPAEMIQQMTTQLSAHKKDIEASYEVKFQKQADEVKELKKILLSQNKMIDTIVNTPIDNISLEAPEKNIEELKGLEKYRAIKAEFKD
jgi:hypothetical protein